MSLRPSIVAVLAMFALAPLAHAGSLRNGDFNANVADWVPINPPDWTATWVADDADGQAGSGAVEIRDNEPGDGNGRIVLKQCIDIRAMAKPITVEVAARTLLEGEPGVAAAIGYAPYSDAACQTSENGYFTITVDVTDSQTSWQPFIDAYMPMAPSVQSVEFWLVIKKPVGSGNGGAVRFDRIRFGPPVLTRWTIDSGGGYLTGGNYVLQATVGQPDPGSASAGGTSLQSGFWFGAAAPPEDALFEDGFE
jgi:hypothetical protein